MEELIRKSEAYSAVLHSNPANAYCILRIKPVDAVEVVHGRWKKTEYPDVSRCSCCDKPSSTPDCLDEFFNYCPHCGAKMDLEEYK